MSKDVAKAQSFPQLLQQFMPEIKRALPKHMDGDRMARIALTEFRKNPSLGDCDPKSIFASIIIGAQLGLEPGIMGQAFLVPYKRTCQFIPGWQGINDLVSRAGRASTWTGAAREGDHFEYALGDRPFITHKPGDDDEAPLTHVYAVGRVRGAEWPIIEVWSINKAKKHRDKYNKVGEKHYSHKNFEMYARKIVLLQVIKYLPKSVELTTAIALDHAANKGDQEITIENAIEGTWNPVPHEEPDTEKKEPIKQPQAATEAPPHSVTDGELAHPDAIKFIRGLLTKGEIAEAELLKKFNLQQLDGVPNALVNELIAWIKNPS